MGRFKVRALLDTHIWIWYLLESGELSKSHRSIIEDDQNQLFLSSVTVWETLLLVEKGRLELTVPGDLWIEQALLNMPISQAPLTFEIARQSRRVNINHSDPADLFIAATAQVMELTLLTSDRKLLKVEGLVAV